MPGLSCPNSTSYIPLWATLSRAAIALLALSAPPSVLADEPSPDFSPQEQARILQHSPLPALPADPTNAVADDPRAARLGQALFFDKRLSANGEVSCATCHDPAKGFSDAKPLAEGLARAERHTQTVWNAAYNRWFFWDGRADSLWAQAMKPIEHPREMGGSRVDVAALLARDPTLKRDYEELFGLLPDCRETQRFPRGARPAMPRAPSDAAAAAWNDMHADDRDAIDRVFSNASKTIAAYERKLISRAAPFDLFVEGLRTQDQKKQAALSPSARRGLRLFVGRGNCRACHSGPQFTDGEFHTIRLPPSDGGAPRDPARYAGAADVVADPFNALGRYSDRRDGPPAEKLRALLNRPENFGLYKTPTLRNVAKTAPYMHDGRFKALGDVLDFYSTLQDALPPGHHQQEIILTPLNLSPAEKSDLIAFLESLTDENVDESLLKPP
ncbi:Cytochrome c551 peroxidase precursor [Phycisphaerae bacterium RAS1]|nr:Cytochrome c551 peroxidase precursor [Phycisphaerae bacterium RAS1]